MTRQQRDLTAAAVTFLTVFSLTHLGLGGTILAAGIVALLAVVAWAVGELFAEGRETVEAAFTEPPEQPWSSVIAAVEAARRDVEPLRVVPSQRVPGAGS